MSPLVSIAIPTYNRAQRLERAIASAVAQTHADLEISIGDNASTDGTPEVCARWAASDPRVRVVRRNSNIGPIGNFNALLAELRGDHAMLLADDDALEVAFVERCLAAFAEQSELALVQGRTRYVAETHESVGRDFDVTGPDPGRRVREYLARVYDNGAFYGLARGDAMRAALPIPNTLGGDWAWVARLVFQGGLRVCDDTSLLRSFGGTSTDFPRIAEVIGLAPDEASHPLVRIIAGIHRDIASGAPVYARLSPAGRRALAARASAALLRAHGVDLIWDEIRPVVERPALAGTLGRLRDGFRRVRPHRPREMGQREGEPDPQ